MSTRVTDLRHGDDARPGQQEQTMVEAHAALDRIDNATCCVLLSFVPLDDGGFRIEVGVAGSGPTGFGVTVANTFRAAADRVGAAMEAQERRFVRGRA